jgi:hypothetical protein
LKGFSEHLIQSFGFYILSDLRIVRYELGEGTIRNSFYDKYRNIILFNKNLLVSGIISFLVGALFTQIYAQYDGNDIVNSLITLVIGYGIYIPLFAFLFYRDNKAKYIDFITGKKNSNKIMISRNYSLPFLFPKQFLLYQKPIYIIPYLYHLLSPIRLILLPNSSHG